MAHLDPDVHWRTIESRCKPCEINNIYNMVAKTESAAQDSQQFLRYLGINTSLQLPGAYSTTARNNDKKIQKTEYSKGPIAQLGSKFVNQRIEKIKEYYLNNVSSETLKQVYHRYFLDFVLFDYDMDGFSSEKIISL